MNRTAQAEPPPQAWRFLLPAAGVEVASLVALAWWPPALAEPARWVFFGAAFAAWGWAALHVKDARGGTLLVWGVALVLRLLLLPASPVLSTEVLRYLWDGHVQAGGFNPFLLAPGDPALVGLRATGLYETLDPAAITPHPPLSQILFAALSLVGGTVLQAKLLWVGFDLGTAWLLGRIAHITGRSRRLTQLLYLWCPLLVVEVAWTGKAVPVALFFLALSVLLARAPFSSGVAAGLAALAAPASAAALPALAWLQGRRFAAGGLLAVAVGCLPYCLARPGAVLGAVAGPWLHGRGFEGPFLLLDSVLPTTGARLAAGGVVLAVAAVAAIRGFRPERTLLWVLAAAVLVSPVLHPDHALWILPFAALRISLPWLAFTGLAFLAYAGAPAPPGPFAPEPLWALLALWVPFALLLGMEVRRFYRERFPLPPTPPR